MSGALARAAKMRLLEGAQDWSVRSESAWAGSEICRIDLSQSVCSSGSAKRHSHDLGASMVSRTLP